MSRETKTEDQVSQMHRCNIKENRCQLGVSMHVWAFFCIFTIHQRLERVERKPFISTENKKTLKRRRGLRFQRSKAYIKVFIDCNSFSAGVLKSQLLHVKCKSAKNDMML